MPIFYTPVVGYILYLVVRFRGLSFLSVNPGLPMSGLIGERKAQTLAQLDPASELARFDVIPAELSVSQRVQTAERIMQDLALTWPVVLKPDFGQRGQDVAVIRSAASLATYLANSTVDILLQEHVSGLEFGIFYMRYPGSDTSQVFSITEKTFPVLIGDGELSLEQLLMNNPRTHYMAEFLLDLHADKLSWVLPKGETFQVVEIGSHCRGSVFLDGNRYITPELTTLIDRLSRQIDGFNFGRYDIRVPSVEDLQAGSEIKVLEVNGVTSESTNMYDPSYSIFQAYRILFAQWRQAFEIGQQAIQLGAPRISLGHLITHLKRTYR
ncbi:carboxylate--amine ligase [Arenicella xantha]|uniref:ATP-grasp domain-containing protein n=1 Tax=Arenicella xantha TaxID=644221 RepID=A0A395JKV0_9GAMM|nr:carboxylate--amine ligase [Arenicella xantha]RBP51392.1 hypothetical protein DFR28_102813 [Arenicella xantha]